MYMEGKLGLYQTDCESILSHLKHRDQQLKLKRRWLMGLPMSKSEKDQLLQYRSLPESLLRDDDIFYETVKRHVEQAFGVHIDEREDNTIQEDKVVSGVSNLKRFLLSCLDALTNKGLFLLAILLTRGSVNFEKTRPKMKKVIKELIPRVFRDQNNSGQKDIFTQLSQLLKDPQNVKDNCLTLLFPTCHSHHASAIKILERLEDLSSETLLAMRRKLRGVTASTPCLQQNRHGFSRGQLIYNVRSSIEKMLSEVVGGEELQAPLAKALAVASLSLKLTTGYSNSPVVDFEQFSPEVKTLQNDIAKAIWLLETKVRISELKTLQLLLDPHAKVSNGCLRTAMKKMLTEYLFECSDLDTIPKSLLEALAIINRGSRSTPCFLKEEIEEELECILSVSAQMKQIVWDLLPAREFDEDFSDAYMEELEESDDGGVDDDGYHDKNDDDGQHDTNDAHTGDGDDGGHQVQRRNILSSRTYSVSLDNLEESCGEFVPMGSKPSISTPDGSCGSTVWQEKRNLDDILDVDMTWFEVESMGKFGTSRGNSFSPHFPSNGRLNNISIKENEHEQGTKGDWGNSQGLPSTNFCTRKVKFISNKKDSHTNIYLGVQEVCDETSMVAYNLIGCMMEKFAQEEGLNLDWSDSSYLRGDYSSQENEEEKMNSSERRVDGSVIVQVVEELLPSLPKSKMEKLKELIGIL
ncbi:hypothetical protein P3X46_000352 [Hevea brasiliensis]|uniref:Uncharacterized protein n=1 Tax=Hevea brasiliensis TaxID=3981 RepID=A0ABQ9NDT6_HEVBR|nr:uncharacterized protein LOC110640101 isoform X2 [Hevea brasiliensis]KAJ9189009.1 hypothetical protein P3X46_000352 [Hevea brasiliensis]